MGNRSSSTSSGGRYFSMSTVLLLLVRTRSARAAAFTSSSFGAVRAGGTTTTTSLSRRGFQSSSSWPRRENGNAALLHRVVGYGSWTTRTITTTTTTTTLLTDDASSTALFMSAMDDDDNDENNIDDESVVTRTWNVKGLQKEVARQILRTHKKVGKSHERVRKAQAIVETLTAADSTATLQQLEACPDVAVLEQQLHELQNRLESLTQLEALLIPLKNKKQIQLPSAVSALALELQVNDHPPAKQPRGPGRVKQINRPRVPYRRYYSEEGIEIRVGKRADDNDELTCNPEHRDGADWWMHAAGCPGSHVVIRSHAPQLSTDILQDAAALAARQSRHKHLSVVKVNLTRCRDIRKPAGAKPGLVQLTGRVETVTVNMNQAKERLARLDQTEILN